jgi:hypothetical protein
MTACRILLPNPRPKGRSAQGPGVRCLVALMSAAPCVVACGSDSSSKGAEDASVEGAATPGAQDAASDETGDATAPDGSSAGDAGPGVDATTSVIDASTADAGAAAAGPRSGLAWMSGSNGDPTMEAKYYEAFGTWRGRPDDVAMLYTDRSSWSNVTGADMFVFQYMKGWPGRLVISQPLFPQDGSTLADCATGAYDAHWKDFGSALVSNDRADSIIRIGWEFNGDFMYWHATNDTAQFISCWNHVAAAIKSTDPQALADWTINAHSTPSDSCNGDARQCYPGDTNVDYIGIDNYDEYPPSTKTPFDTIAMAAGGLDWIYAFAVQHGKRFGVGEWGVVSGATTNGGGDNPAFVQNMYGWFAAHASNGLYESYFSIPTEVDSKIIDNTTGMCGCDNPMASAKYHQLWHP